MASSSPREGTSAHHDPEVEEDFFNSLLNLSSYYEQDLELNIIPPPQVEVAPENQGVPQENVNHPPAEAQVARRGRVSNRKISSREPLTMEIMSSLFHLTEVEAAKEAGWGLANFRKQCKNLGIKRWPYRTLKSIDSAVNELQEIRSDRIRLPSNAIPMMENTRQELLTNPNLVLEPEALRVRKAAQMSIYRRKKKAKKTGETSNNDPERNEEDVVP